MLCGQKKIALSDPQPLKPLLKWKETCNLDVGTLKSHKLDSPVIHKTIIEYIYYGSIR